MAIRKTPWKRSALLAVSAMLLLAALFGCSGSDAAKSLEDSHSSSSSISYSTSSATEANVASDLSFIPVYSGEPYIVLDDGVPDFTDEDVSSPYGTEVYGNLDDLGRCTYAFAIAGPETEPVKGEKRSSISEIKPSGWQQAFYSDELGLDHLYERSHLIAWRLTAENDNPRNLITGTSYMNSTTMVMFEDVIDDYIDATGGHVAVRVTPNFIGDNLVADGVRIEAYSLEDGGASVAIDVYCYNVQPNVWIDYATGASALASAVFAESALESTPAGGSTTDEALAIDNGSSSAYEGASAGISTAHEYVLNVNSMKFHYPDCPSVGKMKDANKRYMEAAREEIIALGYSPCGNCLP